MSFFPQFPGSDPLKTRGSCRERSLGGPRRRLQQPPTGPRWHQCHDAQAKPQNQCLVWNLGFWYLTEIASTLKVEPWNEFKKYFESSTCYCSDMTRETWTELKRLSQPEACKGFLSKTFKDWKISSQLSNNLKQDCSISSRSSLLNVSLKAGGAWRKIYRSIFSGNETKIFKHPCTSLYSDMTWNPPPLRFPNLGKTVFSQMQLPCKCGPWKVNVLLGWTCLEEIAIERAHSNHSWTMLPAFEGSFRPSQPWGFCTRQKSNCKLLAACAGCMTTVPKCYMVHSNLMTVWWTSRKGRGTTASRFLIVIACAHIQASLTHLSFSNDMIVWNPISTAPASFNRPTLN